MIVKTIGLIIIVAGFLFALFTGFDFVTNEKAMPMDNSEMMVKEEQNDGLSPLYGIGIMIVGVVFIIAGKKQYFRPRSNRVH